MFESCYNRKGKEFNAKLGKLWLQTHCAFRYYWKGQLRCDNSYDCRQQAQWIIDEKHYVLYFQCSHHKSLPYIKKCKFRIVFNICYSFFAAKFIRIFFVHDVLPTNLKQSFTAKRLVALKHFLCFGQIWSAISRKLIRLVIRDLSFSDGRIAMTCLEELESREGTNKTILLTFSADNRPTPVPERFRRRRLLNPLMFLQFRLFYDDDQLIFEALRTCLMQPNASF